jgi:hypothetical protein
MPGYLVQGLCGELAYMAWSPSIKIFDKRLTCYRHSLSELRTETTAASDSLHPPTPEAIFYPEFKYG